MNYIGSAGRTGNGSQHERHHHPGPARLAAAAPPAAHHLGAIRIAALKWNIAATEDYVAACAVDGIFDSQTLQQWRLYIASDRVALALLEQQP